MLLVLFRVQVWCVFQYLTACQKTFQGDNGLQVFDATASVCCNRINLWKEFLLVEI